MANEQNLGSLRVSLGLDSAQFTQSVADINRKLKGVKSEFEAVNDGTKEYAQSLDGLKAKNDNLNRQMQLQQQKVQELKRRFEESSRAKGEDAKETQALLVQYNKALGAMKKTEAQIKRVTDSIDDQTDKSKKAQKALGEFGDKAKGIGGAFSATLTPAIGALGLGMLKVADDAEGSTSRIQATLGVTRGEAKKLSKDARELWEQGFGENMEEVETGLLSVKQNFKDLNEADLKKVTKDAMTLAKVMDSDVNEVTRAGNNLMKGFGIDSEKAFDLMAWGGQKGLNFSQEMFDNLSEYAPLYKDMGFSADEYFQMLQKGSESGVYNLDYINDAMKEFQIRAKDGSKGVAGAMGALSESTQKTFEDFNNGKATVKELHNAVIGDLKGMDDQVSANQIGVALYGTKFEDLEADSMYAMGNINGAIKGVDGAMDKSGKNVEKTFGQKLQISWRKTQSALVPLGEELLKVANDVLPSLLKGIQWVTDKFENMSPTMKKITLGVGAFALAIGPAILAVGSIAGSIGGLMPIIAGITGAFTGAGIGAGVLGTALTVLTGPVGIAIGVLALLGIGAYKLDKALDKPIMKSKIFSDEISKSTQKAVGSYLKMDEKATESLNQMAWSQQKVTKKMADELGAKYDVMGKRINDSLDKNYAEQTKKTKKLFDTNSALTAEEEQKILDKQAKDNEKKKKQTEKYESQIKKILNNASKEKRALTEEERLEIEKIQGKMKTSAVKTLSKSEEEQLMILGRLKKQSGKITAEQSADVVANSKKQRDKSVDHANKQYKDTVKQIEYMRDVTGSITGKQADKMIKEAKKAKDKSVDHAEDMHKKVVKEAKKQAKGHADEVDWETGKVKTGWNKMGDAVEEAVNWFKGLFGKGKVKASPKSYTPKKKTTSEYANGTAHGRHNGGMALVGEEGPELAHIPNVGTTMLGVGGQHLIDLPKGSSVLPARHTQAVMKQYGIPMYANGIGDYFDILTKGPKAVWGKMKEKFNITDSVMPSWANKLTGSPTKAIGNALTGGIKSLIDGMFSGGGSNNPVGAGVERWRGTVMQALAMNGLPTTSAYVNAWLRQIKSESGGNPHAVQSTAVKDINYYTGNLARGLVQVIPPTFRAYAFPGHGNQMNGLDSLLAGMNYAKSRYGASTMLNYVGHGHGYAKGGFINEEQMAMVGEGNKQEVVIPLEQYRGRAKQLWLQAGAKLGMLNVPQPSQLMPTGSTGGVGATTNHITNTYQIKVEATINNDQDVAKLAKQIQKEIEREQIRASRSLGVSY
ncbi:phage tail tape measure protein [Peribacillus frigoritolerans]|nr:phage tail tape measure protein [Peribacillus frigoritolerans]